jgi:NADH-quinone oxidoreductase subunit F
LQRVCELTDITPAAIAGVSTFYDRFRHRPVGQYVIHTCHGTACHVKGITLVDDALRRCLHIPEGDDTDPERQFTIQPVACLGCCTLAPAVQIEHGTYGHVRAETAPRIVRDFLRAPRNGEAQADMNRYATDGDGGGDGGGLRGEAMRMLRDRPARCAEIRVGLGSCCIAKGSGALYDALCKAVKQSGDPVAIKRVGCVGMCHRTPMVEVTVGGAPCAYYQDVDAQSALDIARRHVRPHGVVRRVGRLIGDAIDRVMLGEPEPRTHAHGLNVRDPAVRAFMDRQVHIATEHFGEIDPLDLDEYLAHDGFAALGECRMSRTPDQIIDTVDRSGLRGRGGAGFPSGRKWRTVRDAPGDDKYVICNGDEGDPGAFMDRMLLESFPYRVLEGMMIAARAVGARRGIFYIRHEYPLAVARVREAIRRCEARGVLGRDAPGAPGSGGEGFDACVKEGAGAFVCGEETALIASLQGERGMPRLRPPYPAVRGLWGQPTLVNNVESLAVVPWIIRHGAEAFASIGTPKSKGTKVFALAGKVRRGGLIEVPMGITIRQIIEEIGGGVAPGRTFKAVQIGGPSGGCVPAALADTPVDYEALQAVGAIMGSGGLVVMDDTDCMVDIARYFLQFTQEQSCGRCTFCRIGTRRMLEILDRICLGKGTARDLDQLETLSAQVANGSLCGLGKTAPNPVLTTLAHFRDEYEAHLRGHCPAGRCKALIRYQVNDNCIGCTRCAQFCPVGAIPWTPYQKHSIDPAICTRCDVCRQVCEDDAIEVV